MANKQSAEQYLQNQLIQGLIPESEYDRRMANLATLKGRKYDESDAERDTKSRDESAAQNRNALISLIAKHSLFIPKRDMDRWRPTVPTSGTIDGFYDLGDMICIATDGLQAYFLLPDGRTWIGHVQFFHWDVPVVKMVPYIKPNGETGYFKSVKDQGAPSALFAVDRPARVKKISTKTKKKSKRQIALELL